MRERGRDGRFHDGLLMDLLRSDVADLLRADVAAEAELRAQLLPAGPLPGRTRPAAPLAAADHLVRAGRKGKRQ